MVHVERENYGSDDVGMNEGDRCECGGGWCNNGDEGADVLPRNVKVNADPGQEKGLVLHPPRQCYKPSAPNLPLHDKPQRCFSGSFSARSVLPACADVLRCAEMSGRRKSGARWAGD